VLEFACLFFVIKEEKNNKNYFYCKHNENDNDFNIH